MKKLLLFATIVAISIAAVVALSSPARAGATGATTHYALWQCIHHHEAGNWYDRDSGHNRHYGGLQMHYNWGYGIRGYAYNYSPAQQIAAAERGYAASGYSTRWLYGQWAHWDCLKYA